MTVWEPQLGCCYFGFDFLHVAHTVAPVGVTCAIFSPPLNDALTSLANEDVIYEEVIDIPPVPVKLLIGEGNLHAYFDSYLPCFDAYCHDDSPWKVCYTNVVKHNIARQLLFWQEFFQRKSPATKTVAGLLRGL